MEAAKLKLLEDAAARTKSGNVLIFGLDRPISSYSSYFDSVVTLRHVNDKASLESVQSLPKTTKNAAISLSDDFAVGFDFKFRDGASVFVLGERNFSRDQLF